MHDLKMMHHRLVWGAICILLKDVTPFILHPSPFIPTPMYYSSYMYQEEQGRILT